MKRYAQVLFFIVKQASCALSIALIFTLNACAKSTKPADAALPPAAEENREALAVADVTFGQFSLRQGPCIQSQCPVELHWNNHKTGAKVSLPLEWRFHRDDFAQRQEAPWQSPAGLLSSKSKLTAVTLGEEYNSLTLALQTFLPREGSPAVILSQVMGYEHVKRRFDAYMVKNGHLQRIWSEKEGNGPWYSDVTVLGAAGKQHVLTLKGFAGSEGGAAEKLSARALFWSEQKQALTPKPIALPVVAIAAQKAMASAPCVSNYWKIKTPWLENSVLGDYAFVALATGEPLAQQELARLRECLKQAKEPASVPSVNYLKAHH